MKKFGLYAIGIVILLFFAMPKTSHSQVAGEFENIRLITQQTYRALIPNDTNAQSQGEVGRMGIGPAPTFTWSGAQNQVGTTADGRNNGYVPNVPIGFEFEFNGEVYTHVYINANGFLTFGKKLDGGGVQLPPFTAPNNPNALFTEETTYPVNVIAPYWGNHFARIGDEWDFTIYTRTYIRWATHIFDEESGQRVFTAEWRNLNVNYLDTDGVTTLPANVVSFQVKLYENTDPYMKQGDIEFCYGPVTPVDPTVNQKTNFSGNSVGVKGEGTIIGQDADFLNGLFFALTPEGTDYNVNLARTNKRLTSGWPPSQAPDQTIDNRIRFTSLGRLNVAEFWGDGDVDFSKANGQRHFGLPQGRYVTVNDARLILRAVAHETPLDSVRRRDAFHGDVNHNGRFYYNSAGQRIKIPWRSKHYTDDLPDEVSSVNQIYFEATESDAALILKFLGASIPSLPWIYDTVPVAGKLLPNTETLDLRFEEAISVTPNSYLIPVYINNSYDGVLSTRIRIDNGLITDMISNASNANDVITLHGDNVATYAATGKFNAHEPICFIEVETNDAVLNLSNLRLNDEPLPNKDITLIETGSSIINSPNPVVNSTIISFNIETPGFYSLSIYDMTGNKVATILNEKLSKGMQNVNWNVRNDSGMKVNPGVYVYSLVGEGFTLSNKMIVE